MQNSNQGYTEISSASSEACTVETRLGLRRCGDQPFYLLHLVGVKALAASVAHVVEPDSPRGHPHRQTQHGLDHHPAWTVGKCFQQSGQALFPFFRVDTRGSGTFVPSSRLLRSITKRPSRVYGSTRTPLYFYASFIYACAVSSDQKRGRPSDFQESQRFCQSTRFS